MLLTERIWENMCGTREVQRPPPPPEFRYKVKSTTTTPIPQPPDDSNFLNEWTIFGECCARVDT